MIDNNTRNEYIEVQPNNYLHSNDRNTNNNNDLCEHVGYEDETVTKSKDNKPINALYDYTQSENIQNQIEENSENTSSNKDINKNTFSNDLVCVNKIQPFIQNNTSFKNSVVKSTREIVTNNILKHLLEKSILNKTKINSADGNIGLKIVNKKNEDNLVKATNINCLVGALGGNQQVMAAATKSLNLNSSFISSIFNTLATTPTTQSALQDCLKQTTSIQQALKTNQQHLQPQPLQLNVPKHEVHLPSPQLSPQNIKMLREDQLNDLVQELQQDSSCVVLEVTCGETKGLLNLNKLAISPKINSVLSSQGWSTPNQFQRWSGRGKARDWKRSIRHGSSNLKNLLQLNTILLSPPICNCSYCVQNKRPSFEAFKLSVFEEIRRGREFSFTPITHENTSFIKNPIVLLSSNKAIVPHTSFQSIPSLTTNSSLNLILKENSQHRSYNDQILNSYSISSITNSNISSDVLNLSITSNPVSPVMTLPGPIKVEAFTDPSYVSFEKTNFKNNNNLLISQNLKIQPSNNTTETNFSMALVKKKIRRSARKSKKESITRLKTILPSIPITTTNNKYSSQSINTFISHTRPMSSLNVTSNSFVTSPNSQSFAHNSVEQLLKLGRQETQINGKDVSLFNNENQHERSVNTSFTSKNEITPTTETINVQNGGSIRDNLIQIFNNYSTTPNEQSTLDKLSKSFSVFSDIVSYTNNITNDANMNAKITSLRSSEASAINSNNACKSANQNSYFTANISNNTTNEDTSNFYNNVKTTPNSYPVSVSKTNENSFSSPSPTIASVFSTSTPSTQFVWQNDDSSRDYFSCFRRNTRKRSFKEPSSITTRQGRKRYIRDDESNSCIIMPITYQRKQNNKLNNEKRNDFFDLDKNECDLFAFLLHNDPSWSGLYEYPIDLSTREVNLYHTKNVYCPLKRNNFNEIEVIKNEAKQFEAKIYFMKVAGLDVSEAGKEEIEKKKLELHKRFWVLKHT